MTTTHGSGDERSAIVLYGTETGTSQDLAEEVGRCLERFHFSVDVAEFDAASHQQLTLYALVVCVLSTTGQGDFPSNARKFWAGMLRKKLATTTLSGVQYAVVGLGDSSYPKFNWAARKLDKRLRQLGASQIHESCEADEQGDDGTDGAFLEWLKDFQVTVLERFPLAESQTPIPQSVFLPSKWRLNRTSDLQDGVMNGSDPRLLFEVSSNTKGREFPITVEQNIRVTPPSHWQDVRFLRLHTTEFIDYLPGDALAIKPKNMPQDVDALVERLGWNEVADVPVIIAYNPPASRLSRVNIPPIAISLTEATPTLRNLLTSKLDINAIPRRSFFATIANYTSDETHKERLLEFTDPQYLDEYYDYATRSRRSILEILQEFHSVKLPWQEAINIFPPLRARQFSIASGGKLRNSRNGTVFELLVAIVRYRTVIKRIREGVCTRYLAQLAQGSTFTVILKTEGRFSDRYEISGRNHLLIGAGTGVAPLRALIHEKASQPPRNTSTAMVFGSRNAEADYFFADEWTILAQPKSPLALQIFTAFSRDQKLKVYVQDRIRKEREHILKLLLDHNTIVIVCGASGQMPKAVRQALADVLTGQQELETPQINGSDSHLPMSPENAEEFLVKLEKDNRYKQETWS